MNVHASEEPAPWLLQGKQASSEDQKPRSQRLSGHRLKQWECTWSSTIIRMAPSVMVETKSADERTKKGISPSGEMKMPDRRCPGCPVCSICIAIAAGCQFTAVYVK